MKDLRPPAWQRWAAWTGTLGLFFSGIALAWPSWVGAGAEGPFWDALRSRSAALHGALGMAFLVVLGTAAGHVRDGLRARRNTAWGLALLASLVILALSAWGLYYLSEDVKAPVAQAHLVAGLALPVLLLVHAWRGKKRSSTASTKK